MSDDFQQPDHARPPRGRWAPFPSRPLFPARDRHFGGLGRIGRTARRDLARRLLVAPHPPPRVRRPRSEEHTSELPSLMRISYAVFCLKKKKTHKLTLFTHKH